MGLRDIASDVGCLLRRDGVRATVRRLGGGFRRGELLVIAKRLDEIQDISFRADLHIEALGPPSLPALAELNRRRCDRRATARFAADIARGHQGFVASSDGGIVGYYWWTDGDHPHLRRLGVELQPGDVYGFDFFVAEEQRGEGRAVGFLHAIETSLMERGFTRLWGYVRADNRPARWLYSMRGYEVVKHVDLRAGQMR
jgi:GNAT superfamily N-acetyltransferase